MQKKYCSKCGQATEYKSEIPSFCSKCGHSFAGMKSNATNNKAKPIALTKEDDHDEYESDDGFNSPITSLAFDVERYDVAPPTIGQIASLGPQPQGSSSTNKPKTSTPINEEQFLKDFQQEAGSIKQQNG